MIRPDCATRKAGAPSVGLLNVPYSTFAGASVARGATHSGRPFRRFVTSRCEKPGSRGAFRARSIDGQGHFLAHKLDPKDFEIFPKVGAVEIDLVDFSRQSLKIHAC